MLLISFYTFYLPDQTGMSNYLDILPYFLKELVSYRSYFRTARSDIIVLLFLSNVLLW